VTATVSQAVDPAAGLWWGRVNDGNWSASVTANPATGVGGSNRAGVTGALSAAITIYDATTGVTANFGGSAYACAAAAGFGNL
jgi:hypothetical protein